MRWSPTLLLPLCLVTTACGTSAKHQALVERRSAIRLADEERELGARQAYRSKTGFQATRWGMTREEVLAVAPGAVAHNAWGDLRTLGTVAGRLAVIDYVFADGQLAEVTLHFQTSGAVRGNFGALDELLTLKYGKPASRSDSALDAAHHLALVQMANNLSEASANYHAARSGVRPVTPPVGSVERQWEANAREDVTLAAIDYELQNTWKDAETELLLTGRQEPGQRSLTLQYQSVRMKPYLSKELAVRSERRKVEQSQEL
ncbi:hypothetical protein [Myxococcus sp. Y35]|uniref:hypothetical protein n=1 Tax=Pseudomyxococcus flavus TaxID=3115648 RepID=UPI003CEC2D49